VVTVNTLPAGVTISIERAMAADQTTAFPNQGFLASDIEDTFDKVVMLIQQDPFRNLWPPSGDSEIWMTDASGNLVGFPYGTPSKMLGTDGAGNLALLPIPTGGGGGGGGVVTGGGVTVASYDAIRQGGFVPETPGDPLVVTLADRFKGGTFMLGAAGQRDNGGTILVDVLNQCWNRVFSGRLNAGWFYNCPNHHLGDGSGITITATDLMNNPQWIGMPNGGAYPVGTTWAYVALQEALYACFAQGSTPGHVVWNMSAPANRPLWIPAGNMTINQGLVLVADGIDIEFAQRLGSMLNYTGPTNVSAITFDAISYGAIRNLSVTDATANGVSTQLVDMNYSGAHPGLATQQLSLYDWAIGGNGFGLTHIGVYIARSGGSAQGDTVAFFNPIFQTLQNGLATGGQNAISISVFEGNFQEISKDSIACYAGTVFLWGTSFQNQGPGYYYYPQFHQVGVDGADLHVYGGQGATARCSMYAVRSESNVLLRDQTALASVVDSGVAGAGWLARDNSGDHYLIGYPIGTGGAVNTAAMLVDDGGPGWFFSDPSSTDTHIVYPGSPGWTTNQWAGRPAWLRFNNGICEVETITASDANSITVSGTNWAGTGGQQYPIKITGIGGTTDPAWDAAPQGFSALPGNLGYGFTTTAGSNIIQYGNYTSLANGMYVVICGAYIMQPVQAGVHPSPPGPLIGRISGINTGARTFNLVDAVGAPLPASLTLTDTYGYWGSGVADGQLQWLPLDFDVMFGAARATNVSLPKGRLRDCGVVDLNSGVPQANMIRSSEQQQANFRFSNSSALVMLLPPSSAITASPVNVGLSSIEVEACLNLSVQVAALTVNMPLAFDATTSDFRLIMTANGSGAAGVVTWGSNVRAAAPTLTLGAAGKITVVTLTWMGSLGGGP
jgi:hypothetical protein